MQASVEGRLFIRNATDGMLMQLKTTQNKDLSYNMELSLEMARIPGVKGDVHRSVQVGPKPERPSILTYILAWFSKDYARQVEEYRENLAIYKGIQRGQVSVVPSQEERVANANTAKKEVDKDFEERQAKIEAALAGDEKALPAKVGLKPYVAQDIKNAFAGMKVDQKNMPENSPIALNQETMGVLVTMALASNDLQIKARRGDEVVIRPNEPEKMYPRIVGTYVENKVITGSPANFVKEARKAVTAALTEAANGDFSKLGKIVADGLKLNNKILEGQKELSNTFTVQAEMGAKVLKIMKDNPQLQDAVQKELGEGSKVLDGVRAAKNISDLRVAATTAQRNLVTTFASKTYMGSDKEVGTVAQAYFVEFDMKQGKLDLETSPYKDPKLMEELNNELQGSSAFAGLREDKINRAAMITDPMEMVQVYTNAVLNHQEQVQQQENVPVQEKNIEMQQQGPMA